MEDPEIAQSEAARVFPKEEGVSLFATQLELLPDIKAEFMHLSGRNPGTMLALMDRIGDKISFNPDFMMTPERLRVMVEAPANEADLPEWRGKVWDDFKAEQKLP